MKISLTVVIALITGFFLIQSSHIEKNYQETGSFYPAEVKKVIDNKCFGCHSPNGKSQNAKNALMWDNLPSLQKSEQIAKLNAVIKVLTKNSMPPSNAVKQYPEMKLLPGESKTLQSWAESKADNLLK